MENGNGTSEMGKKCQKNNQEIIKTANKMNFKILILSILFIGISCTSDKKVVKKPVESQVSIVKSKDYFIKAIFEKEKEHFIIADAFDFLMDDEAVKKAKEQGDADYYFSEKGDTIYTLDSDQYLFNPIEKWDTLALAKNIKILMLSFSSDSLVMKRVSLLELTHQIQIKGELITGLKIKEGKVIEITEQYVP